MQLVDLLQKTTPGWPFPDAAERKAYHTERATQAEKEGMWLASAFHLGRLRLDDPDNAEWKKRREEALAAHADPSDTTE